MLDFIEIIHFIRRVCKGWHEKLLGRKARKSRKKRKARSKRSRKALNGRRNGCRLYLSVLIVILIEYYKSNFWRRVLLGRPIESSFAGLAPYRVHYYKRRYYDKAADDLIVRHNNSLDWFKALKLNFISNPAGVIVTPLVILITTVADKVITSEQQEDETRTEQEQAKAEQEMEVMMTLENKAYGSSEEARAPTDESKTTTAELLPVDDINEELIRANADTPSAKAQANTDEQPAELSPLKDIVVTEEQTKTEVLSDGATSSNHLEMPRKHNSNRTMLVGRSVSPTMPSQRKLGSSDKNPLNRTISLLQPEYTNKVCDLFEESSSSWIQAFAGMTKAEMPFPTLTHIPSYALQASAYGSDGRHEDDGSGREPSITAARMHEECKVGDSIVRVAEQTKPEAGTNDLQETHTGNERRLLSCEEGIQKTIPKPAEILTSQDCDCYKQIPTIPWYYQISLFAMPLLALALIGTLYKLNQITKTSSVSTLAQNAELTKLKKQLSIAEQKEVELNRQLLSMEEKMSAEISELRNRLSSMQEELKGLMLKLQQKEYELGDSEHRAEVAEANDKEARAHLRQLTEKLGCLKKASSYALTVMELVERPYVFIKAQLKGESLNSHELAEKAAAESLLSYTTEGAPKSMRDESSNPYALVGTAIKDFLVIASTNTQLSEDAIPVGLGLIGE